MKVILTGGTGNIGKSIQKFANFDIVYLNRNGWDSLDILMNSEIDLVIHAAGDLKASPAIEPLNFLESNLRSTVLLLESMARYKIDRLIFLSSCAVYGNSVSASETDACNPLTINGIIKLLNERIIQSFCIKNQIEFRILRAFNVIGGVDRYSVFNHIKQSLISNNKFCLNNNGIGVRDFIHVDDVAKIICEVAENNYTFDILNIGTGIPTQINDVVSMVREKFPELIINHIKTIEIEQSIANIEKLKRFSSFNFVKVEDFIRNEFIVES